MSKFEQYVYERFANEMRTWPPEIAHDIYVIIIYIFSYDGARFAELSLNYNTLKNWRNRIPDASDAMEAKWNYAFWPHDDKVTLCKSPEHNSRYPDLKGIQLRDKYLWSVLPQYDLSDSEHDALLHAEDTAPFHVYENALINAIVDVCSFVIYRLHQDDVVTDVCNRSVPIVMEFLPDSGDDDYRLASIEVVNPPGLAHDYLSWT